MAALVASVEAARNADDMKGFAGLFAEDADFFKIGA
ncbi:MAG: hypothetical protein HW413_1294 [Thermoleophilia bacterium]|nr:hypothetical protein [Thermoleophilia bacterium]